MDVDPDEDLSYTVDVYDLWTLQTQLTVTRAPDSVSPALDLMAKGYVAKSPRRPSVAVSIRTLQLLYRLRQRKASFSIEAFAKVICDYYNVSLIIECRPRHTHLLLDSVPAAHARGRCRLLRTLHAHPACCRSTR